MTEGDCHTLRKGLVIERRGRPQQSGGGSWDTKWIWSVGRTYTKSFMYDSGIDTFCTSPVPSKVSPSQETDSGFYSYTFGSVHPGLPMSPVTPR